VIFDESTLRKISRLTLVAHQVRAGVLKGERRSVKRGASLEFADYRNYTPGDDLRRLDWNAYARLDRPFLKLFEEEEDLAVHVLLDGSQSMNWGEGDQNKFHYGLKLAAALGAIALSGGDRLSASLLRVPGASEKPAAHLGPLRGEANTLNLLRFLESLHPGGQTDLSGSLRDYALSAHRPGLAFLISDLFTPGSPEAWQSGVSQLQGRGYEVTLIHLLAPQEIQPPLAGDLRLLDVETGHTQEVSVDGGMRRLYDQRLQAWRAEIHAFCQKRAVRCLEISTAQPWDQVVLQEMRKSGAVK
jgi:uncharacterized protein (DUF58 family)